jgi:hypothetical protein
VAAVLAALDMPAQSSRAALLDRRHNLELSQAHMSGIGLAPVGTMTIKDVCDLQLRAAHRRLARPRVAVSLRSMVRAGRVGW